MQNINLFMNVEIKNCLDIRNFKSREYYRKNIDRLRITRRARDTIYRKKIRGELNKFPICSICSECDDIQYHHPNYVYPDYAIPVCRSCHKKLDAIRRTQEKENKTNQGLLFTLEEMKLSFLPEFKPLFEELDKAWREYHDKKKA